VTDRRWGRWTRGIGLIAIALIVAAPCLGLVTGIATQHWYWAILVGVSVAAAGSTLDLLQRLARPESPETRRFAIQGIIIMWLMAAAAAWMALSYQ
jgi:4-amino-4-deoxy-L-arabinose transferase-like glycosyltransferase